MDFKQIQELIKTINKSNIGELHIEEADFKITIKQKEDAAVQTIVAAPSVNSAMNIQPVAPVVAVNSNSPQLIVEAQPEPKNGNQITIKSPMIGTFYRRSSPDKPYLSEVGDEIVPGKVLCIIEAMKLFNEIESEVGGRIVKILVEDSSPVEFDQPLFIVEP